MNKETILKLYENFIDQIYLNTDEKSELIGKISEEENMLLKTLNEEQKEQFNNILNYQNMKNEIINKDTFVFAYSLATRLIIESMENKKDLN